MMPGLEWVGILLVFGPIIAVASIILTFYIMKRRDRRKKDDMLMRREKMKEVRSKNKNGTIE